MDKKQIHDFEKDHSHKDLKEKSVRGGIFTLSSQLFKFVVNMGSTMILARLLLPSDFGLVAMVSAVIGLGAMFKDAGLSDATLQRHSITHDQISTLFWINILISFVITFSLCALAPAISYFYGDSRLTLITIIMAGSFLFSGLSVQHHALLKRQLKFRSIAVIDALSMFLGNFLSILCALLTRSYWSLVVLPVTQAFTFAIGVWLASKWVPGRPRNIRHVMPMLIFGGNMTAFNGLCYLVANADKILIGWKCGATQLGYYSKAYQLMTLPLRQFVEPIKMVAVPGLCRLQKDHERFRRFYGKAMETSIMISMPVVALISVTSELVVRVILGPQWGACSPIIIAMAVGTFLDTFNHATGWAMMPHGQVHRQLRWQLFATPVMILAFFVGLQWGPIGVAAAYSVTRCLKRIPALWYAFRCMPMKLSDVLWDAIKRPTLACLISGSVVYFLQQNIHMETYAIVELTMYSAIFSLLYILSLYCMPSGRQMIYGYIQILLRKQSQEQE